MAAFGACFPTNAWAEDGQCTPGFTSTFHSENKMNNENDRVLGRILAVEETEAVSGAKQTSSVKDAGTFPPTDTGHAYDTIPVDSQGVGMSSFQTKTL